MIANPARGQLNTENIPRSRLRIWSSETGSAVPCRVSPFILHTHAESGAYSWDSSHFSRRRKHKPSTAIGSVPSLSGPAIAYPLCSLPPRVRRHSKASSKPDGSSSNGCSLFRCHHGPIIVRLAFPKPTIGM